MTISRKLLFVIASLCMLFGAEVCVQKHADAMAASEKSSVNETRRQLMYAREMATAFAGNPELAGRVIASLGNWSDLSRYKVLGKYSQAAKDEDMLGPLLVALDHCRRELTLPALTSLYSFSSQRMRDKSLPVREIYTALKVSCRAISEIQSHLPESSYMAAPAGNERSVAPVAPFALELFLRELILDNSRDIQLRRAAAKNLGALRCFSSAGTLAVVAENDAPDNPVALRRTALLALPTIDPEKAFEIASETLAATGNSTMFSAAALVLGRSATICGLETLLRNSIRCPSGSLAIFTAVRYYRGWVALNLKDPSSPDLLLALQALPYCQAGSDDLFKFDLIHLLQSCNLGSQPEIARAVLRSLLTAKLTASDCRQILEILSHKSFAAASLCPDELAYFNRGARSVEVQECAGSVCQ